MTPAAASQASCLQSPGIVTSWVVDLKLVMFSDIDNEKYNEYKWNTYIEIIFVLWAHGSILLQLMVKIWMNRVVKIQFF